MRNDIERFEDYAKGIDDDVKKLQIASQGAIMHRAF
jgi:hypothetical protein